MGLLVLSCVVATVLTLVSLTTIAVVQVILYISVRNAALVLAGIAVYGFIESRRRQIAKGFYTCTDLPDSTRPTLPDAIAAAAVLEKREPVPRASEATTTPTRVPQAQELESTEVAEKNNLASVQRVRRKRSLSENEAARLSMFVSVDQYDIGAEETMGHSMTAVSDSSSVGEDAQAEAISSSGQESDSACPSGPRLPELRRKKWTTPSQSMPLKHKGETLLIRRSASSASSSPRRPELYGSPRSVAMEQKMMKSALESDGYWIGDFRMPQPALPRRTRSMGLHQTAQLSPASTSYDRTASRAV